MLVLGGLEVGRTSGDERRRRVAGGWGGEVGLRGWRPSRVRHAKGSTTAGREGATAPPRRMGPNAVPSTSGLTTIDWRGGEQGAGRPAPRRTRKTRPGREKPWRPSWVDAGAGAAAGGGGGGRRGRSGGRREGEGEALRERGITYFGSYQNSLKFLPIFLTLMSCISGGLTPGNTRRARATLLSSWDRPQTLYEAKV